MAEELELKNAENDELLPVDSVLALTLPSGEKTKKQNVRQPAKGLAQHLPGPLQNPAGYYIRT